MSERRWDRSKAELLAQKQDRLARLLTLLARCNGRPCPSNDALGRALGIPNGAMPHLIASLINESIVVSQTRAASGCVSGGVARKLAASDGSWSTSWSGAGGQAVTAAELAAWTPPAVAECTSILVRREPAPVRTRCPRCNLPPLHAECRHGWNGQTTAHERRDIAAGIGRAA